MQIAITVLSGDIDLIKTNTTRNCKSSEKLKLI